MLALIKSKSDRERVRWWLRQQVADRRSETRIALQRAQKEMADPEMELFVGMTVHQALKCWTFSKWMQFLEDDLCGPPPKAKAKGRKNHG